MRRMSFNVGCVHNSIQLNNVARRPSRMNRAILTYFTWYCPCNYLSFAFLYICFCLLDFLPLRNTLSSLPRISQNFKPLAEHEQRLDICDKCHRFLQRAATDTIEALSPKVDKRFRDVGLFLDPPRSAHCLSPQCRDVDSKVRQCILVVLISLRLRS